MSRYLNIFKISNMHYKFRWNSTLQTSNSFFNICSLIIKQMNLLNTGTAPLQQVCLDPIECVY